MQASSVGDSSDRLPPTQRSGELLQSSDLPLRRHQKESCKTIRKGLANAVSDEDQPHQGLELPLILLANNSQ
jgi:hypothetical protein